MQIPVRHDVDAWLREYLNAAGEDDKTPLFPAHITIASVL
jgi:hypothetical protein